MLYLHKKNKYFTYSFSCNILKWNVVSERDENLSLFLGDDSNDPMKPSSSPFFFQTLCLALSQNSENRQTHTIMWDKNFSLTGRLEPSPKLCGSGLIETVRAHLVTSTQVSYWEKDFEMNSPEHMGCHTVQKLCFFKMADEASETEWGFTNPKRKHGQFSQTEAQWVLAK